MVPSLGEMPRVALALSFHLYTPPRERGKFPHQLEEKRNFCSRGHELCNEILLLPLEHDAVGSPWSQMCLHDPIPEEYRVDIGMENKQVISNGNI